MACIPICAHTSSFPTIRSLPLSHVEHAMLAPTPKCHRQRPHNGFQHPRVARKSNPHSAYPGTAVVNINAWHKRHDSTDNDNILVPGISGQPLSEAPQPPCPKRKPPAHWCRNHSGKDPGCHVYNVSSTPLMSCCCRCTVRRTAPSAPPVKKEIKHI